jgi:hypothetical protein
MAPSALWLPFEVTDLDAATRYCADRYQSDRKSRRAQNVARPAVDLVSGYFRSPWYYTGHLELSVVDGWQHDTERGVVLAAGAAYVEFVTAAVARPGPIAFQLAEAADVDRTHADWRTGVAAPPRRYPRGHYGFEAPGPAGARVMVWSEDERS